MAGGRGRDTGDTTLKSWAKEGVLYPLYLNKGMCGPCDNNLSGSGLVISESSAHHDLHPCGQDAVKETGYCHLTEASMNTWGNPLLPLLSWSFSSSTQRWATWVTNWGHSLGRHPVNGLLGEFPEPPVSCGSRPWKGTGLPEPFYPRALVEVTGFPDKIGNVQLNLHFRSTTKFFLA